VKWLFRILVAIAIATLSSPAFAQSQGWDYWRWRFVAVAGDSSSVFCHPSEFGVSSDASDNYDDDQLIRTEGITSAVYAATYHNHTSISDSWSGPTGFYDTDLCAPVPLRAGESKSWLIYLWATPGVPDTYDTISVSCLMIMPPFMPSEYDYTLTLAAKPSATSGGPAIGTTWRLSLPSGVSVELPIYRTDNGLTGYQFELTATAVPEPSSILALLSGLVGIGGVAILRRK